MSRYTVEHKANTRAHIVATARNEFRANGFDRASIDKLMAAAGLTRGGFYAHFDSKEDLVREVLQIEPGLLTSLRTAATSADPQAAGAAAVDKYLDPAADDQLQCPLVAHPMDVVRGGNAQSAIYTDQVSGVVSAFDDIIGPESADEAIVATILAVGSAVLGTATKGHPLSKRFQAVGAESVRELLSR